MIEMLPISKNPSFAHLEVPRKINDEMASCLYSSVYELCESHLRTSDLVAKNEESVFK